MFLLTIITLACCTSLALSGDCYYCQNFEFEDEFYDANCDNNQYSGHIINCEEDKHCFTDVYEDGRLHRGCQIKHNGEQCVHHNYPHQTQCFCEGDLCNVNLCNECIDGPNTDPTIPTTETASVTNERTTSISPTKPSMTTVTSGTHEGTTPTIPTRPPMSSTETPQTMTPELTSPSASGVTTETPQVTTQTPKVTTNTPEVTTPTKTPEITTPIEITTITNTPIIETTTRIKIVNITCYDCQNTNPDAPAYDENCSEPGYNGETYACDNCGSCFTEVHDDGSVIRGEAGDFEEECAYSDGFVACYCTKDLCNSELCDQCDQ